MKVFKFEATTERRIRVDTSLIGFGYPALNFNGKSLVWVTGDGNVYISDEDGMHGTRVGNISKALKDC